MTPTDALARWTVTLSAKPEMTSIQHVMMLAARGAIEERLVKAAALAIEVED